MQEESDMREREKKILKPPSMPIPLQDVHTLPLKTIIIKHTHHSVSCIQNQKGFLFRVRPH